MPAVHIRDVPERTLAALRERARQDGISMQAELRRVLDAAAQQPIGVEQSAPISLITAHSGRDVSWSREEIYDSTAR